MKHGRPKTTGRFKTRAELVSRVFQFYTINDLSISSIASNCKVSDATANGIINRQEWNTLEYPEDYAGCNPITGEFGVDMGEAFDVDVNLDPRTHSACGAGYDFPLYVLHVPDRIKRDLDLI